MEKIPPHINCIKGKKDGPNVVITGAVHGNEQIGEAIISRLLHEIKPETLYGELILILGNPEAYAANKRFIDFDLNRLFSPSQIDSLRNKPIDSLNTEEKRALELEPYLKKADYLLDIHSTIKPSVPFIFCEKTKEHFRLANLFNTEYIVSTAPKCEIPGLTSCTDNYVNEYGGIGLTYETGWSKELTLSEEIMGKTYQFLQAVGSFESNYDFENNTYLSTTIELCDYLLPLTTNFHFKRDFSNFDTVEEGEEIAQDGDEIFKSKNNSFVIFPKVDIIPGKPACYLGIKTELIN